MGQIIDGAFYSDYDGQDIDRRLAIAGSVSNLNMLDNAWFTVNQRGVTTLNTSGFISDRWHIYHGTGIVNADKTITFTATQAGAAIYQISPYRSDIVGKTVTLSLLKTNGDIQSGQVVMPASGYVAVAFDDGSLTIDTRNNKLQFTKNVVNGQTVNIRAFKLELGSVSTLANDVAPDYTTELLECQRYFRRYSCIANASPLCFGYTTSPTNIRAILPISVPMASVPTISYVGSIRANANGDKEVSAITLDQITPQGASLNLAITGGTQYSMAYVYLETSSSYLDLSAHL